VGAEDNLLNRAIGRKMLIAAVRRVRQPGCKFDNIVIFEGPQESGKSTLVRVLAGEGNFSDAEILNSDKKEQQELCEGVWFYELAELAGIHRSEVERLKAFASRQEDKARPAYGRSVVIRPRTCVFVGTTNDKHYLQDRTGNRRFWPVEIGRIDIEGFRRDRDQLFAEAGVAEAADEGLELPKEVREDLKRLHNDRMIDDPWAEKLWMFNHAEDVNRFWSNNASNVVDVAPNESGVMFWRIPSETILSVILGIKPELQNNAQFKKVAGIMTQWGWRSRDVKFSGRTRKCWVREKGRYIRNGRLWLRMSTPVAAVPQHQSIEMID